MTPADLRAALESGLPAALAGPARSWLDTARQEVAATPERVRAVFPAVRRKCGGGPLPGAAEGLAGWTVDDAARTQLLAALPLAGESLGAELADLYRYGDAAERRGVLRSLAALDDRVGDAALPIVHDALRTNDTRIVAAALGPYSARLTDDAFRQAVLKCVFVGVPLGQVAGLQERADAELARMLADFAQERIAAGREVPADVWLVLDRFPEAVDGARLAEELSSPVPERRAAAERALAGRTPKASAGSPQDSDRQASDAQTPDTQKG